MLRRTLYGVFVAGVLALGSSSAFAQKQAKSATAAPAGDQAQPAEVAPSETGSGGTVVQLRSLEQRVNELKERIFRSKARLNLLKETVLHGVIAGSRAVIKHKNEMGGAFRLIKLIYALDGQQLYTKSADDDTLHDRREFEVFSGGIVPGSHTISVTMVFRGHGYGVFTYLKGYRFTVRASHTFAASEGRQNIITVRAHEKGNVTTELKDRPAIKFETSLYKVRGEGAEK